MHTKNNSEILTNLIKICLVKFYITVCKWRRFITREVNPVLLQSAIFVFKPREAKLTGLYIFLYMKIAFIGIFSSYYCSPQKQNKTNK
jgi:hypothetical protein